MSAPLFSVITPTYNRASYLRETISSILSQDYPYIEYIVLDDGSTDDTIAVLESIDDPRLHWEHHENMGEVATVNKGYMMAQGEFIAIVNSDDPVLPGFISTTVEFMQTHPELLAAYPDWNWIDEDSRFIRHERSRDYSYTEMLRWHVTFPASGAVIRRHALDFVPQRDPALRYRADFDFWLQLGLHGPMARIPATLANFRVHPDSATLAQRGEQMATEHLTVVDKVYAQPDLTPEVLAVRGQAYASAHYVAGLVWLGSETPERATHHFRQAVRSYPQVLWRWPLVRWRTMLRYGLPQPLVSTLRLPLSLIRRMAPPRST